MPNWLKQNILYIAWGQALVATLGSLYSSQILHWTPCVLCWYQRIFMFPLVFILAVGILKKTRDLAAFVLPLSLIGIGIAAYHSLLQWGVIPERLAVCQFGVPCVTDYHLFFNFLTLPVLSLLAFLVITICMVIFKRTKANI